MNNKLSDMALDIEDGICSPRTFTDMQDGIKATFTEINAEQSKKCMRKAGVYYTVETDGTCDEKKVLLKLKKAIKYMLKYMHVGAGRVLVVGLGNENYIVDSLGGYVLKRLTLCAGGRYELCMLSPSVSGVTNIESFDVVKAVSDRLKPRLVIAVDTLATSRAERLGKCYQLTTAGLKPGGGVTKAVYTLSRESIGVNVLAIGVPLVMPLAKFIGGASDMIVTPLDVDNMITFSAKIIAGAINAVFQET